MFDVRRPNKHKPNVIRQQPILIRPATGAELSEYEKRKLANIENNAQKNKIEIISVNNERLIPTNKEVNIDLGTLALKDKVQQEDISSDETFFIKCELSEDDL